MGIDDSEKSAVAVAIPKGGNWNTLFANLRKPPAQRLKEVLATEGNMVGTPPVRSACYDRLVDLGIAPITPDDYNHPEKLSDHNYATPETIQNLIGPIALIVEPNASITDTVELKEEMEDKFNKALARKRQSLGYETVETRGIEAGDVRFPEGFFKFFLQHCQNELTLTETFSDDNVTITAGDAVLAVTADLQMAACKAVLAYRHMNSPILNNTMFAQR